MERRHNEEQARERDRTLAQLHEVEQQDLVLSGESFDCPICFMEIDAGEGVMLRDCLHLFCRYNTLRSRQNDQHFADDIFECIFLNFYFDWNFIEIHFQWSN